MLPHAADRFAERVRPGLSRREASIELTRLVREFGRLLPEVPDWLPPWNNGRGRSFVGISDGVVVVVEPAEGPGLLPRAVTVLTRATFAPERRQQVNDRRRRRPSAHARRLADRNRPSTRRDFAPPADE